MNNINIFESAKPLTGEFFKFKDVGDSIQGTYIDARKGVDSFGNNQIIYTIIDTASKVWNIGFSEKTQVINERMKTVRFGQIVGFRFDEKRPSKKQPGTFAKIIRIYADPKLVDHEWLKNQQQLDSRFEAHPVIDQVPPVNNEEEEEPVEAEPAEEGIEAYPADEEIQPKKNEALEAIRALAKNKKIINSKMTEEEGDAAIEAFTGLSLTEANFTKIIIALTSKKA